MPIWETILAALMKAGISIAQDKAIKAQADKAKALEKTLGSVQDSLDKEAEIREKQNSVKVELPKDGGIKLDDKL